jgi:hypothetical protein
MHRLANTSQPNPSKARSWSDQRPWPWPPRSRSQERAMGAQWNATDMTADGLSIAVEAYQQAQDDLIEARNRLARAIEGAAMPGLTRDEIVDLTRYPADRVVRILQDAGISEAKSAP